VDPFEKRAPEVLAKTPTAFPTLVTAPRPAPAQAQTVVFQRLPANIYISFADGPGVYRLEVVDDSGAHLRNLFEKRVVAQEDGWVEWDGRDDAGQNVPPGQYTVLYTKDGRELKRLILVKTAEP
jgi:flagellar hook assembly protein FlgD